MAIFKHIHKNNRFQNRAGCTSRREVRRLMEYILRLSAQGKIVWNSFGNDTAEGITGELMALARPDLKYKAYHFMMSFPMEERAKWEKNLDAVIDDFGSRFKVHRMVWASHEDKDNFHVHGLVFAQNANGNKLRLETMDGARAVPVALSLRKMAVDWEDKLGTRKTGRTPVPEISISKDALEMANREHAEGKTKTPIPAKLQLRADIQRLVALSYSCADLQTRAAAEGIEVRFTEYENGTGVSFANGTVSLRGRDAGYTFPSLTQLYNEPNPRIKRSQPTQGVAKGNRPRSRRSTSPRTSETDRRTGPLVGGADFGHRDEPSPYRGIEKTIRHLAGLNNQAGLLGFLDFLTRALTVIGTSADATPAHHRRPTL